MILLGTRLQAPEDGRDDEDDDEDDDDPLPLSLSPDIGHQALPTPHLNTAVCYNQGRKQDSNFVQISTHS